ncbi:MAG: DeoR/GlpR transcriptional regulator [Akkermansia sp.]|nr:DeoR/GlpR transcriptional regulator [Akkermansia sp.]
MYLAEERRQYILRLLEQRGSIRTTALARELGVTDETIRTDLVAMQNRGLLQRMHGGARYIIPSAPAASDSPRLDVQLAHRVLSHIRPGMHLYAEPCSFTRVLLAQMQELPCTFITPSPAQLADLGPAAQPHTVICTGGTLNKKSGLLTHPAPTEALQTPGIDVAILCPPALSPTHAAYAQSTRAAWASAAAQVAQKTLLVVPSGTLSARARHQVKLPPYILITEDNLPPEFADIPVEIVPYISEASLNTFDF